MRNVSIGSCWRDDVTLRVRGACEKQTALELGLVIKYGKHLLSLVPSEENFSGHHSKPELAIGMIER